MQLTLRIVQQQFIGVIALFLVLGGFAYAVSGQAILLGRPNIADKPTAVQNTGSGAVLDLQAKTGQPPLKVNSSTLVPKLNADTVDGKHASAFALAGTAYTKAQSDARYAPAGSSYTKAQTDAKYATAGSFYTKAQSDGKYAPAGSAYTKAEGDARYGRVLLSESWQGTSGDGSETQFLTRQVAAPGAGTLMLVVTQSATPGSTPSEETKVYVNSEFRAGALVSSTTTDDTRVYTTVVDASETVSITLKVWNNSLPAEATVQGALVIVFFPMS